MTGSSRRPRLARTGGIVAAALVCALLVTVAPGQSERVGALAPPEKRVMLVTDSVGLGTRGVLDQYFPADWDVSIVGKPAVFVRDLPGGYIQPNLYRAGDHVVIAAGYNYPFWDPARFEQAVDATIETLTRAGVKHVYWVTLREVKPQYISAAAWRQVQKYYWYFPTVNEHLERALERHPSLTLIDWAAVADRPGITYDAIHLNRTGAELYSSLISGAVVDARTRSPNNGVTRVNVAEPSAVASGDVTAVAVNLTSVRGRTNGYVSAFACEQGTSSSSNLNHRRDEVVAAAAIVPVGASGDICVFTQQAGHVVVDVFGRFNAEADITNTAPVRVLDSRRPGGSPLRTLTERRIEIIDADVDDLTRVVALNVTVTQAPVGGYLTVHRCGDEPPTTSNVNFAAGAPTPNLVIATTDESGAVCVTANRDAHVIVDRLAVFGEASTLDASHAERLLDTRGGGGPVDGETVEIVVPQPDAATPSAVSGIAGNLTVVRPTGTGFATAYPCSAGRPATSNINYRWGTTVANAVIVQPDADGKVCVYTSRAADVVFDLLGSTGDGFAGVTPSRPLDTRQR